MEAVPWLDAVPRNEEVLFPKPNGALERMGADLGGGTDGAPGTFDAGVANLIAGWLDASVTVSIAVTVTVICATVTV